MNAPRSTRLRIAATGSRQSTAASHEGATPASAPLLALQQTVGNAAVQHLVSGESVTHVQREESDKEADEFGGDGMRGILEDIGEEVAKHGLEHAAEKAGYPLVKAGLAELAPESAIWLQLGGGAVSALGGAHDIAEGTEAVEQSRNVVQRFIGRVKQMKGGLGVLEGAIDMGTTVTEAAGLEAPAVLETVGELASGGGLVAGAGLAGWAIGRELESKTSVGPHAQETLEGLDAYLTEPGHRSWMLEQSEKASSDWDQGHYGSAAWSGTKLGLAGLAGGLGGLGGGILDVLGLND